MDLHDAFTEFVRKYYEGFDYAETNKVSSKPFGYDFKTLDKLHQDIVPKSKNKAKDLQPILDDQGASNVNDL